MELRFKKLKPESVRASEHIVKSSVEMLCQSYSNAEGLFEDGLNTWEWFIYAKDESEAIVGFLGWSVHTLEIDGKTLYVARTKIGATSPDKRGQGMSQVIFRTMFEASLKDAAERSGKPDSTYPNVFGWGVLISPFSYLGMTRMFSPTFFPDATGNGDGFAIKAAKAIREQVLHLEEDGENPFALRGFEKFAYNESEKQKHKLALKQKPVKFFNDLNLSVEKGDRVLIIYGVAKYLTRAG